MVCTIAIGGFMGVGKTTVGRLLAQELGSRFHDLDAEVEALAGQSVSAIFATEGEAGFRDRESATLAMLLDQGPSVLALGGGTLHHGCNLQRIRAAADLVVLSMPWAAIRDRLGEQSLGRPLWVDAEQRYRERIDGYLRAGQVIEVEGLSSEMVACRIKEVVGCA
jgi:shikimate kinase